MKGKFCNYALALLACGILSSCRELPKAGIDIRNDSSLQICYELHMEDSVKYSGIVDEKSRITIEDFEEGVYTIRYWPSLSMSWDDHYRSFSIKDEDVVVVEFNPAKGGWRTFVTERYR